MKKVIFCGLCLWANWAFADARSLIRSELARIGQMRESVKLVLTDEFPTEKNTPLFMRRRAVTIVVSQPQGSDHVMTISKTVRWTLLFSQKYLVRLHFADHQDFSLELDENQMDEPFAAIQSVVPLYAGQVEGRKLNENQWRTFRSAIHALMEVIYDLPEEEIVEAWL